MENKEKKSLYQIEKKLLEERNIIRNTFIRFILFVLFCFFIFLVFLFYFIINSL
jgi:hypothetical protein